VPSDDQREMRVVSDLDGGHMLLLDPFTRTANELGLGSGEPDFDKLVGR
jgi:hypothetical protein